MAHINLLPWRDEARARKQQEFVWIAGFAVAVSLILIFFIHVHMSGEIEYQNRRNTFLENEIRLLEKDLAKIKELESTKKALLDRMNIIQELQIARPGIVHLFDEMVTTLPDGLYLSSLQQKGPVLTLTGKAESKGRVAAYMRNLEASPWIKSPQLQVIEARESDKLKVSEFSLNITQTSPQAEEEEAKKNKTAADRTKKGG